MNLTQTEFEAKRAELAQDSPASSERRRELERELAPYKVDNAVILAAGLSSRFAPLSYDTPKGLLRVKGEVMIERQIAQLKRAGVEEIYVVVGYKQEKFFYLEDTFGVHLVYNPDYAKRNNSSSMWVVREHLKNTYVCSADVYYDTNPFHAYEYTSYYSVQYSPSYTKEWVVATNEAGHIESVQIGADAGWYMIGEAYFDAQFSRDFRARLEACYGRPDMPEKLWEDVYLEDTKHLHMVPKEVADNSVHEFDSLDELIAFDSRFLENADSKVFDNICACLGCKKTEIHDVYPLDKSLTNLSCHFAIDAGEFVYRHPGAGTEDLIDRANEKRALEAARSVGLDHTFVHEDEREGWKISHFVKDARNLDPHNSRELKLAMDVCKRLHTSGMLLENTFDFYEEAKRYTRLLADKGHAFGAEFKTLAAHFDELAHYMAQDTTPTSPNHNDFFHLNFLLEESGDFNLIDWEYAGMGDDTNDLATFSVCCELTDAEVDTAINLYYNGKPTASEKRHVFGMIGMCGWCWYLWSLVKEQEGDNIGPWLLIYYHYAKKYLKRALEAYRAPQIGAGE